MPSSEEAQASLSLSSYASLLTAYRRRGPPYGDCEGDGPGEKMDEEGEEHSMRRSARSNPCPFFSDYVVEEIVGPRPVTMARARRKHAGYIRRSTPAKSHFITNKAIEGVCDPSSHLTVMGDVGMPWSCDLGLGHVQSKLCLFLLAEAHYAIEDKLPYPLMRGMRNLGTHSGMFLDPWLNPATDRVEGSGLGASSHLTRKARKAV